MQPNDFQMESESWSTWANLTTGIRTIVGLALFVASSITGNEMLNFAGLVVYWSLDILDGYLARRFDQETRLGAQFDILADRLLVAYFYFNYVNFHPEMIVPVAFFLFNFMLVDHFLSNQFMRWPILSPNYFGKVDDVIFKLNWSPLAKGINSGLVTILLVVTKSAMLATAAIIIILASKFYSLVLLKNLGKNNLATTENASTG